MKAANIVILAAGAAALAGCATLRPAPKAEGFAPVNPASIAAAPATWDGRQVEMVGLLVWEFETLALYQSYGAYCRGGERTAILVDWPQWPGVTRADSRRTVMVRGTFRNRNGVPQPDGTVLVSNAAPGPGPLEPGQVIRWLSPPMRACPAVRP